MPWVDGRLFEDRSLASLHSIRMTVFALSSDSRDGEEENDART